MKRQKVRELILLVSLLLFPITIYYFSPYLIIAGAMEGIITGSFITFAFMLILSIFFGRAFCGYICPAGGLQEAAFLVNDRNSIIGKRKYIKYVIWIIWIAFIAVSFFIHGSIDKVDSLFMTDHGISVSNIYAYIIYYFIICLLFVPSLIFGKRAFCHYLCWMAPFMVLGTKIRNAINLPGLHLSADASKCVSCRLCNKNCPMSLDVERMVQRGECNDSECILCGACVDTCPKKALQYRSTKAANKHISQKQEVSNGK
jgi:polyferredoxin